MRWSRYQLYAENCSGFALHDVSATESDAGMVLKQVSAFSLTDVNTHCRTNGSCGWGIAVYGSAAPMSPATLDETMRPVTVLLRNVSIGGAGALFQDIRGLHVDGLSTDHSQVCLCAWLT